MRLSRAQGLEGNLICPGDSLDYSPAAHRRPPRALLSRAVSAFAFCEVIDRSFQGRLDAFGQDGTSITMPA
jgi:hypothetical protein